MGKCLVHRIFVLFVVVYVGVLAYVLLVNNANISIPTPLTFFIVVLKIDSYAIKFSKSSFGKTPKTFLCLI